MTQTASTSGLAKAQRTIIASSRYTEEHNAPAMALIEHMTLTKGSSTVTVPKVGQMTITDLVDGQDIIDTEEIGMSSVDLTAAEVGAKVIITDKLVRQMQENVWKIIGRQLGDGMARKKDTDVHALYTNLNGGTALGVAGAAFDTGNITGAIGYAKANKFGDPLYILQHPNSLISFMNSAAVTPSATYPVPEGWAQDLLGKFFIGLRPLNGVPIFEDGNLSIDATDDVIGVIAAKDALVVLESVMTRTERQRDASLRATELVMTSDYGVFELDDAKGASWIVDASAGDTTST